MIEIIPSADNVAAFRIEGTLEARDYDEMIPHIDEKLRDHEAIGVFVDMVGFNDMTGEAMRSDLKYGIDKLGDLHRFRRMGLASDKQWVKAVMEIATFLIPRIEFRVFAPDETDEALSWVAETGDAAQGA